MSAAKDRDDEMLDLLRAIRQELMVARAPRAGAVTLEMAAAILACSKSRVHELLGDGTIKRWPTKGVGKEALIDVATVWAVYDSPPPRERQNKPARDASEEAERLRKLKFD